MYDTLNSLAQNALSVLDYIFNVVKFYKTVPVSRLEVWECKSMLYGHAYRITNNRIILYGSKSN